jgi:hypothetical protein
MAKLVASTIKIKDLVSGGHEDEEGGEKKDGHNPYVSMKLRGIQQGVFIVLQFAGKARLTSATRRDLI